jgi:hypothetical protein
LYQYNKDIPLMSGNNLKFGNILLGVGDFTLIIIFSTLFFAAMDATAPYVYRLGQARGAV